MSNPKQQAEAQEQPNLVACPEVFGEQETATEAAERLFPVNDNMSDIDQYIQYSKRHGYLIGHEASAQQAVHQQAHLSHLQGEVERLKAENERNINLIEGQNTIRRNLCDLVEKYHASIVELNQSKQTLLEAYAELQTSNQALVEANRWVPVSEGAPTVDGWYITKRMAHNSSYFYYPAFYCSNPFVQHFLPFDMNGMVAYRLLEEVPYSPPTV